jgi:hypothetical protein
VGERYGDCGEDVATATGLNLGDPDGDVAGVWLAPKSALLCRHHDAPRAAHAFTRC